MEVNFNLNIVLKIYYYMMIFNISKKKTLKEIKRKLKI
jgi:hypothetical protein